MDDKQFGGFENHDSENQNTNGEQYSFQIRPASPEQMTGGANGWNMPQAQAPEQQHYDYYEEAQQRKAKKSHRQKAVAKTIGLVALTAAVSVGSTFGYLQYSGVLNQASNSSGSGATTSKVVYQPTYSENSLTNAQIYADNVASVVAITCQTPTGSGVGTGIIYKEDGYIITNDHVVGDALSITVKTYSGDEYQAKVVGSDEKSDIAVIKIDAKNLKAATFGDSDEIVVGEPTVVIGNPLGLEFANTMTQGAISSTSREIEMGSYIMKVIQTDASINPGNSGGPMFNSRGQVIGVVSSKIVTSEAVGIGFAIPSNTALKVVDDFIQYGAVQDRAMLGVTVQEINDYYAAMQNVKAGVRVEEVTRGGAAEEAGIQAGDYIRKFNGKEITSISQLNYEKDKYKIGDTVDIVLERNGKEVTVKLVLKTAQQVKS